MEKPLFTLTPVAKAVSLQRPAVCVVVDNPMKPEAARVFEVPAGTKVRDLDPGGRFPYICRLEGQWLLRAGWDRNLGPGECVEFMTYPQGGGNGGSNFGRIILMVVAMYLAVQTGGFGLTGVAGMSASTAVSVGMFLATTVINLLVPVGTGDTAVASSQSVSTTYNTNLSANQARLDQPIPVLYGRNKTFPDYAAEPYSSFADNDDQYFNALFCLGQGEYKIESILIDDTNISNFSDVRVNVLPPGIVPTFVSANVSNAAEVTGNEVPEARYIGPFIGCRPRTKASRIAIDISFSRGLATYDASGNPGNKTVGWKVQYRAVDDFGVPLANDPLGNWQTLASPSLTAAQTEPVRRTYEYDLATPCRPQVRLVRTTPFDPNSRVANTLEWAGMRCFLQTAATLCSTATHIEVRMRATEQLSGLTQRKIAVVSRRRLRTWHPVTGFSAETKETRNAAWALLDKWTNPVYGDGYATGRYDLEGLFDLAMKLDTRQDRFDAVFSQTYDSFQADQMIAQSGRSAVFRRNAVMTVTRDEQRDIPVTAYNSRSIAPGSVDISYAFAHEGTPDGVIVEYWDNRAWDWMEITCPAPGVATPVRPQRLKLFGVTGAKHAEREGLYNAAQAYWRRKFPSFTTELEGMIPAFGSAVVFAPSLPHWGHGGEVVTTDNAGPLFKATLSEPAAWDGTAAKHYISMLRVDGSLSPPYEVTKGVSDFEVIFVNTPDFTLFTQNAYSERTRYVFGAGAPYETIMRVLNIRTTTDEKGVRSFVVSGVVDDERVHTADKHLLPSGPEVVIDPGTGLPVDPEIPPVVQDPIDNPTDPGTGSGTALIPYLGEPFPPYLGRDWGPFEQTFHDVNYIRFASHGFAYVEVGNGDNIGRIGSWWVLGAGPYTPAQCGDFSIRATLLEGDPLLDGTMGAWLSLSQDRSWNNQIPPDVTGAETPGSLVLFEIRLTASGEVLASREMRMGHAYAFDPSATST